MSQQWVYFFGDGDSEGDPNRKDLLGGKGASLAAMSRAKLPVPPGFTISVECCPAYHSSGGRWPDGLEQQVRTKLAHLESVTGRKFGTGGKPLLVSVRSGAAVSMPGMMDTLLNCGLNPALAAEMADPLSFWRAYAQFIRMFGRTTADLSDERLDGAVAPVLRTVGDGEDKLDADGWRRMADAYRGFYEQTTGKTFPTTPWEILRACINAVFDSWNNERAITYRKAHDIRGVHGTAVTVQAMFPSRMSGIAFTANPTNPKANEIVIESAYGLGEAIVSGMVTPDRWTLDHYTLHVKEAVMGVKGEVVASLDGIAEIDPDKPSLDDEQVQEVGRIALQVEKYFGYPVDIEWAWADGRFALLQSRAVRGIEIALDVELGREQEIKRLRTLAGEDHRVWVIHNLAETLAAPTPLTWDIIRHFMSGAGGFGMMYRDFGYRPSAEVIDDGFLDLICGRIYADPRRAAALFWDSLPMTYNVDEVLKDKSIMEAAPTQFDAGKADGRFLVRLPGTVAAMIRCSKRMKRAGARARTIFENEILPPYRRYVEEKRTQDLTTLTTEQVIDELNDRRRRVLDEFGKESLKPGFFGGVARGAVETLLVQLMGEQKGVDLTMQLTGGLEGDSTVEQNLCMFRVAKGEVTLEQFLADYGHRATGEMELAEPRWREDPTYVQNMVEVFKTTKDNSPESRHEVNVHRRREATAALADTLAEWGGASLREDIEKDLADAQALLPYRETGKHWLMMGYELIRRAILDLSRRWDLGRDVFFLHLGELAHFENQRDTLLPEIAKRKIRWQSAKRLEMPDLVDSQQLDSLGVPREFEHASELKGDALASGVASGRVKIVYDPKEAGDLGRDCILVCPSTDPGWTALFVSIKGLIVERGGALSHGAITARDFGIPAVACPDATKRVAAGASVRVDGNRGLVTLLDEGAKQQ
jgi:phosphohistidine swiveling domain-containing protein